MSNKHEKLPGKAQRVDALTLKFAIANPNARFASDRRAARGRFWFCFPHWLEHNFGSWMTPEKAVAALMFLAANPQRSAAGTPHLCDGDIRDERDGFVPKCRACTKAENKANQKLRADYMSKPITQR